MEQYISKSAIVEEIKRRINEIDVLGTYLSPKGALTNLLCSLDTIEVKEVDLKKEYDDFQDLVIARLVNRNAGLVIAKHFFELGLKAQEE